MSTTETEVQKNALNSRIDQIATSWTMVARAASHDDHIAAEARRKLLSYYSAPIYRFLYGAVRDFNLADDLAQEFAVRCLQGKLNNAQQSSGRFRDYLKTVLRNLVTDYFRAEQKQKKLVGKIADLGDPSESLANELESQFITACREDVLNRTWQRLKETDEKVTGSAYYVVLKIKSEDPNVNSTTFASILAKELNRSVSSDAARQMLSRARKAFKKHLIDVVSESIRDDDCEKVRAELIELDLLQYCPEFS